jgi:hypothetical protein
MKKLFVAGLAAASVMLTSGVHADEKQVGKASSDSTNDASSNKWGGTALAVGAVAVAVVAIILVANHGGHHHHGH